MAAFRAKYGWEPVPHSTDEIDNFAEHMKSLYRRQKNGDLVFDDDKLTPAITRWIKNERALCSMDCEYYLTRYHYISAENRIFRFNFRGGQRVLFEVMGALEEQGVAIEIQLLKARQGGFSTAVEGVMTHRSLFVPGVKAAIASANDQKTYVMMGMFYTALDNLPWWLPPRQTKDKRSGAALLEFGSIGSQIVVQSGSMRGGIGQGTTPTAIHISECCLAPNTLIRTEDCGVKPITEIRPGDMVLTANGRTTRVVRQWKAPRENELTCNIFTWGTQSPISCTRDHRILCESGWKEAKDVRAGDYVVYPVRPITTETESITIDDIKRHQRAAKRLQGTATTSVLPANFALGRLLGLYLAEGCLGFHTRGAERGDRGYPSLLLYSIHCDEIERTQRWISEVFPTRSKGIRRKNSKTATIPFTNRGFAKWVGDNFGNKDDKRVPDLCWKMGREFARGVVYGYLMGDGHLLPNCNGCTAPSVRLSIPVGIRELIASLGYGWSSLLWREAGPWYGRQCREQWSIHVNGETGAALRRDNGLPEFSTGEDRHWKWLPDGSIAVEVHRNDDSFAENVYDLEVEDDSHAVCTVSGLVHNCDYPNALVTIEEGLFKAVHSGPEILMILESTGNGNSGWWADQWRNNKEFYFQGRSRLYPLFIPWFMTPELYPKREWMEKFKIPYAWEPNASTKQIVAKCEAYARNSEALRPVIGTDWKMPRDQQWFWEFNYEDAKRRKTDKSWLRHMPCDDFDALIGDNDSSFDRDAIVSIDSARKKTCQVYGILGEGIPEKHDPDPAAVDYDEPRVTVNWRTVHDVNLSWMLMPLKGDVESSGFDPLKKLLVWEPPERGAYYSIGVDTGFGVGGDRTVITVNRCGQDSVPDMQVAEFAADDIGNTEVYAWAMAIAAWYGKFMEEGQTPRFVIEQRRKFGDSCYHALKLHGFRNHHHFRSYDRKTLRPVPSPHQAEGWYTNEWSRPLLLGTFKHAVENGWYTLNSRFTLAEVEALEQIVGTTGRVRQDHRYGEHDDRVFAAAMAYFTWHDNDLMAERSKQKYSGPEESEVEIDYGPAVMTVPNLGADEFFSQFLDA